MKKLFLILICISLLSCGKSVYYVYDQSEYKDHYSYCTLEITRKNEIIYRAASYKYWYLSYPVSNVFLYLYSNKYETDVTEKYYRFVAPSADISYVKNGYKSKFNHFFITFDEPEKSIYYSRKSNDTIYGTTDFDYIKNVYSFKEHGINWFPPYMVKVDKIDYTKFGSKIQHLNLKNPKRYKK